MGFRTIDLDTKEGQEKYKKLKETKSVRKTFKEEKGIENFVPRPEEKEELIQEEIKNDIPVKIHGVVEGVDQLRVREKPEGEILFLISSKSVVTILEDHDGWYKVETAPGRQGYVMKQFIKVYSEGG